MRLLEIVCGVAIFTTAFVLTGILAGLVYLCDLAVAALHKITHVAKVLLDRVKALGVAVVPRL